MDGQEEQHDFAVCREGTYAKAMEGIRLAVSRGFRVTTNTTLFEGADPNSVRGFFDEMMDAGVEGMSCRAEIGSASSEEGARAHAPCPAPAGPRVRRMCIF
jgi:sulfatase maturation enzyme AslB (radical SAM superfamily)